MGVVLAEMTAALNAFQGAAGLITEVVGNFANADGQLAVAVRAVGVDHHVVGAVHRAQNIAFTLHFHGGEHVLTVMIPVAGSLVQVHGADAGGHNVQVAALALLALDVIFQLLPDDVAVGQEHGQAAANQVVGHEQAHFLADLAVVALAGFLLLLFPGFQLFLVAESNAVDAGQHLVLFVILLLALGHQLHSFIARQDERLDGKVFLADLLHFLFNVGKVFIAQFGIAQVNIIEKAVFGSGAKGKVGLRIQALDGLCHNVGSRMAQNVQFFFFRAFGNSAVFVNDFHW